MYRCLFDDLTYYTNYYFKVVSVQFAAAYNTQGRIAIAVYLSVFLHNFTMVSIWLVVQMSYHSYILVERAYIRRKTKVLFTVILYYKQHGFFHLFLNM